MVLGYCSLVLSAAYFGKGTAFMFMAALLIELFCLVMCYLVVFIGRRPLDRLIGECVGVMSVICFYYFLAYYMAVEVDGLESRRLIGNFKALFTPLRAYGSQLLGTFFLFSVGYAVECHELLKEENSGDIVQETLFKHMLSVWAVGIVAFLFMSHLSPGILIYFIILLSLARFLGERLWPKS